jgi:hypothetical protein
MVSVATIIYITSIEDAERYTWLMAELPVITTPAHHPGALIDHLARRMRQRAEAVLAPLGLRPRHLVALTVRDRHRLPHSGDYIRQYTNTSHFRRSRHRSPNRPQRGMEHRTSIATTECALMARLRSKSISDTIQYADSCVNPITCRFSGTASARRLLVHASDQRVPVMSRCCRGRFCARYVPAAIYRKIREYGHRRPGGC